MKHSLAKIALVSLLSLTGSPLLAVEGGIETYLLGSRDSFAGILPPPGSYWNNDFVVFNGSAPAISLGGIGVANPEISVFTYKFNFTHVFEEPIGNTRVGINVNIPYVSASMDFSGVLGGLTGTLADNTATLADITVTPILGWSSGKLNTALALQFFLPTGKYQTASVNVPARTVDMLNTGKNRFAFDPTLSMTWFDPSTGWELTGALGVTISARNDATDDQTAPEAHLEATAMRHLPNKMALGLTGYAYHQIGDDSGTGADSFKAQIGATSLQSRVFGLSPVVSWSTKIGNVPLNLKAKYIAEFGAKRRFESNKFWFTAGIVF